MQDPSIEGDAAGTLSFTFSLPTPILRFGVARTEEAVLPNGAIVELFDASNGSLGVTNLTLSPVTNFAEVQFDYVGQLVKRATVSFRTTLPFNRFAFDNLVFQVPEPATLAR